MSGRPLKPETYEKIIDRDLSSQNTMTAAELFELQLNVVCQAYRDADQWTSHYLQRGDAEGARITAASRDRFYEALKTLLRSMTREQ